MVFSRVAYNKDLADSGIVAQVNRRTGQLYLNPRVWSKLNPAQRKFILLHEKAHLKLQTKDETEANAYAISYFLPSGLSKKEVNKNIETMTRTLDKDSPEYSNFAIDPVSAVSEGIGKIAQALPALGIGSRARMRETEKMAAAQVSVADAQKKAAAAKFGGYALIAAIIGVFVIAIVVIFKKAK